MTVAGRLPPRGGDLDHLRRDAIRCPAVHQARQPLFIASLEEITDVRRADDPWQVPHLPFHGGDARQGVPYEALIDALGFDERVTKRIQRDLQREGLVELTTVPPMTHIGRPVMDHAPRHRRQQTSGMTPQGMRLVEDLLAMRADTARPTPSASPPA
jgi:hypothetical protein